MKEALDELAPSSSQSVATNCPTGKRWSNSDTHTCQELADYYGCDDIVRGCLSHSEYNTKWKTAAGGRGRCFGCDDIVRGCLSHSEYNTKWNTPAGGRGRCFGND